MIMYLVTALCLCFLFTLTKLFNKLWLTPIRVQKLMASQGIRGPPYIFMYGNTKDIISMRREVMNNPMELSHTIFPRLVPHYYSWIKLYGRNFLTWIGSQAELVVSEAELSKMILDNRDGAYTKPEVPACIRKLFGDGISVSTGEKWRKNRKLADHAFHSESLKAMTPSMISAVEMMLDRWRNHVASNNNEIEVFHEFKLLTSEVISRTAFGSSYLEGEDIFNMLNKLAIYSMTNLLRIQIPLIGKFLKTKEDIESDELERGIREAIVKIVRKREESGEGKDFGGDFLGSLVNAYRSNDDSKKISLEDVIDECKTFYVAGQETTSSLLCWTVLLLAIHTDWQDKARKEVVDSFGHQNPTSNGISRLVTMGMIINESLRLYTPASFLLRRTRDKTRLGDIIVPANTSVKISTLALHHDPEIWGRDAHLFNPERFAQGVAMATNNNSAAYIPFGSGPRTCVGLNFAANETKIALSMILQRYKFTLSPNYVHSPTELITLNPQHGVKIILHKL